MGKYVNEKTLNSRKRASTILLIFASFGFIFWGFCSFAMILYGDIEMFFCVFIFALITIIHIFIGLNAIHMKKLNDCVYMYTRYFEGDIDGYIYIDDMVRIIGKDENRIYSELVILLKKRILCDFIIRNFNGRNQIVLGSKIKRCECKNCGAVFDKRMYFAGTCPYCKSSDIYAEAVK